MAYRTLSRLQIDYPTLPSIRAVLVCSCYISLNVGLAFLMGQSFVWGIGGIIILNLLVLLVLKPRWAIPLYILVAGPSLVIPLGEGGILSRLFAGNLVIVLLIAIGAARTIATRRKTGGSSHSASLMLSLTAQAIVGFISIIYSRLQPDPGVIYSFRHASISLTVVNSMEMVLLLGLPIMLMIVPGLIQTMLDVKWIVRAFMGLGMLYALGTIFALPLGLSSQQSLLGMQRPQIFSISSSTLGLMLVFFACIALGQALYPQKRGATSGWWLCTIIFSIAVILSYGRNAWLALFVSVLTMVCLRKKTLVVLPILLVAVLLLFIPGVTDFFNPDKVYGIDRVTMWQDAITIWLHHPYAGVGAGNYQFFDIAYGKDIGGVAHNQFLEVLAEQGVQGLLCLLWSIVAMGRLALQRFQIATTAYGKAITIAYIGYYTALLLSAFFQDSFLSSAAGAGGTIGLIIVSYYWLLLGVVLALPQWERSIAMQRTQITARTNELQEARCRR